VAEVTLLPSFTSVHVYLLIYTTKEEQVLGYNDVIQYCPVALLLEQLQLFWFSIWVSWGLFDISLIYDIIYCFFNCLCKCIILSYHVPYGGVVGWGGGVASAAATLGNRVQGAVK
jgi:hypothetical protein